MKLFSWFKKKKPVLPINIDPTIGSEEWCADLETVTSARELFSNQTFRAIYSIMVNERPSKKPFAVNAGSDTLAAAQMYCAGYEYALDKLIRFSHHETGKTEEPMTFPPEEEQ